MTAEALLQSHRPPTPPNGHIEFQSGLQQITEYTADRNFSLDELHQRGSEYGAPGPTLHDAISHPVHSFQTSHGQTHADTRFDLGIRYDDYGHDSGYCQDSQAHGMPTGFHGSPPTPRSTVEEEAELITRSRRTLAPPDPPEVETKPRVKATPKMRKKAGKSEKPRTPKLTAALSILTKDMNHIPVRNMEEWVNRPAEVRRKEVEKRNGYITRPMNSFMLYRSAYAERTKQWCTQNNHQVVSSVSGESWPMEPPEVRELYNEYAKIERINHQNAHPTYKFSPSKAAAPARKRKGDYSDDEPSDLDDAEWAPGQGRSRTRPSKRHERAYGYPANTMNADFFEQPFGPNGNGMNKSSWDMTNAGRPVPMPMQGDPYNQYLQQNTFAHNGMHQAVMEDMRMRRMDTQGSSMQFSHGQAMLGLPGGNAADMMQHLHSHVGTPLGEERQVDPMLLAFDGPRHQDMEATLMQPPGFRNGHMDMMGRDFDQDSVHSFLQAEPSPEDFKSEQWQHDPSLASMDQGSEFEKWMDDHQAG